jgi:hypothetical protein
MARADLPGGVTIDPIPPGVGKEAIVTYSGKLAAEPGSEPITLMIGYGPKDQMFSQREVPMRREGDHYVATFVVDASDTLNMAFKDSHGHIDDNDQQYWSMVTNSNSMSYA